MRGHALWRAFAFVEARPALRRPEAILDILRLSTPVPGLQKAQVWVFSTEQRRSAQLF